MTGNISPTYLPNTLLDLEPHVGVRYETVRFDLIDPAGNTIGELHPARDQAPSIACDTGGTIKRRLDGLTVTATEFADVNPYRDRLAPFWLLSDGTQWPLGVYHFTGAPVVDGTVNLTAMYDGGWILDQPLTSTLGTPWGGAIDVTMERLIDRLQVISTLRFVAVNMEATDARTREPIVWPAGTPATQVLDQCCALAGFYPPHFDNRGVLQLRPALDPEHGQVSHFYGAAVRVVSGATTVSDDLLEAANVHVVVSSGATETEVVGEAEVDVSLPWSVQNRGFRVVEVHREQGLTSSLQARWMARRYAAAASRGAREVEFVGPPDPRHDVFDIVDWDGTRYLEVGWSLALTPGGEHRHRLQRGGFV